MLIPGLVSVSFRERSPRQVLDLCRETGLRAVEWGGDVHVPPADEANARAVCAMSAECGVEIAAYGSYYRLGQPVALFEDNLRTALWLRAPAMRIWAGSEPSRSLAPDMRAAYTARLIELAKRCADAGITLAPEFHGGTLTDSLDSLKTLLEDTRGAEGLRFYWQPRWDWPEEDRSLALRMIGDRLQALHVFTWRHEGGREIRLPLARGEGMWRRVLSAPLPARYALMEFVEGDRPDNLRRDAATLRAWLEA